MSFGEAAGGFSFGKLSGITSLGDIFNLIWELAFAIGLALGMIFIIISGIKWITSAGNPEKAREAKNTLTNTIIGIIIIISFVIIINIILGIMGVPNLQEILGG